MTRKPDFAASSVAIAIALCLPSIAKAQGQAGTGSQAASDVQAAAGAQTQGTPAGQAVAGDAAKTGDASDVRPPNAAAEPPAGSGQTTASTAGVEDIVVTAQKRSESIQNVPLSIVAVSGTTLERTGVRNVVDLQKLVPSLKTDATLLGAGVSVRIRGFGSPAGTATDSDVATYLDGAFVPRPGSVLSSFLDVKSVEVLSGPQGTLFGRNASMGAVSVTTNAPSKEAATLDVKAEGSSYDTFIGTIVANTPATSVGALRLAVQGSHTDGFYRNSLDGKKYGGKDEFVGRLSGRWDLTSNLNWTLRLDGSYDNGDRANPFSGAPNATPAQVAALSTFVTQNGGTPPVLGNTPSFRVNQQFRNPFFHDHQIGLTSDLGWTVSPVLTLRLIDSYRDWNNVQKVPDSIGTTLDILNNAQTNKSEANSHELQLISAKDAFLGGKLSFTSGIYHFHEDYQYDVTFNFGSDYCRVIFTAVNAPFLITPCNAGPLTNGASSTFNQSADSTAVYLQVNYKILPRLELALGGRETWDSKSANFLTTVNNPIAAGAIASPESHPNLHFSDNRPSVRASLSWHITDRVLAFGTFSTGYKSGGFNSGVTNPPLTDAQRTFASETVDDYEAGLKSTFLGGKARLNATFFDTELHNFQDRSFNGQSFIIRNSGDVRSRGVDFDGELVAPAGFRFNFAATYLDSIYSKNTGAPGLEGCTGLPGCPTVQDLSGRPLPNAPHWQGNVGVNWTGPQIADGFVPTVLVSENFTTSFLTSNTDNPQSRLPSYETTDINIALTSPRSHVKLELFGTNVFDRRYFVTSIAQVLGGLIPGVTDRTTGGTIFRGFAGDPRRLGARLSLSF